MLAIIPRGRYFGLFFPQVPKRYKVSRNHFYMAGGVTIDGKRDMQL